MRKRHGLDSDRKLAKFLGINQGRVSLYRTGARKLDPEACLKVAKALELPPEHVFAAVQAERAKRTEHRRIWERLAKLAKNAHVLGAVVFVAAIGAPAAPTATTANVQQSIFCQITRAWRRWLAAAGARAAAGA